MPVSQRQGSTSRAAMSTSERLQAENKQMEMRLQELKSSLKKRKEQRKAPGVIWRSGKSGAIKSHVSEILKHSTTRRQQSLRKVKVLGSNNKSISRPQPPPKGSKVGMGNPSPSGDGPVEDVGTAVMWNPSSSETAPREESDMKCDDDIGMSVGTDDTQQSEVYDEHASHASFLEALNEWRLGRASDAVQTMSTSAHSVSVEAGGNEAVPLPTAGGALLDGEYDESGGLASFREAVNAWREAGEESTRTSCRTTTDTGTDGGAIVSHPVEVVFTKTSTLSLVERMMLGRARKGSDSGTPRASDSSADHELRIEEVQAGDYLNDGDGNAAVEYAVDEPSDDNSDEENTIEHEQDTVHDGSRSTWRTNAVITPAFSPNPSPHHSHRDDPGNASYDDGGESATEVSPTIAEADSSGTVRSACHDSGGEAVVEGKFHEAGDDVDGEKRKSIITPVSLMHDFEEMEKSFSEES
eukprot:m.300465 g.300465  ORF g.300465 m.300465 type:complete len:468 (+) comp20128_c0_seq1:221-1624(+)